MRKNVDKFVFTADGKYEVYFEDGEMVRCDALVSVGKKYEKDGVNLGFQHVINYSDGVRETVVLSIERATLPDCSLLAA